MHCVRYSGGFFDATEQKDSKTHALAKRLASLTGESLTQAVKQAVQERLASVERSQRAIRLADELDYITLQCAALSRRDRRHAEQIIGCDELGLSVLW